MEGRDCILILFIFEYSHCEWILVSPISSKLGEVTVKKNESGGQIFNVYSDDFCPDFHNLTAMSYSSESKTGPSIDWEEISVEDVKEFVKENEKIPKTSRERKHFLAGIEETMMAEAEKRIKNLFPPGPREARFVSFHFPSMEGSLMTISMLIFGVYLTKLILKLLQSQYSKYHGAIGATRKSRSIEMNMRKLHLMNLIDEHESKFH